MRKDLLLARIASGTTRLRLGGRTFVLRRPSADQLYEAEEIYEEQLAEARQAGSLEEEEALAGMVEAGLWSAADQARLDRIPDDIDDFKRKLYLARYRSAEARVLREALARARQDAAALAGRRHAHDHATCQGAAAMARARFLVFCGLHTVDGRRVFGGDFWRHHTDTLDQALAASAEAKPTDAEVRELARTDPWRTTWSCRQDGPVFDAPACRLTDEQRALVAYSCLYDSVWEHPDSPEPAVVEDDDLLDGWLSCQRRDRDNRKNKARADAIARGRPDGEIYVVAQSAEDAARVMEMNDEDGRRVQRQRFSALRERGQLNEAEMPDTRDELRRQAVRLAAEAVRGK